MVVPLVKDETKGEVIPREVEGVLEAYKDVMPPELPKALPPMSCPEFQTTILRHFNHLLNKQANSEHERM